jgi:Rha family phage regulatory protein
MKKNTELKLVEINGEKLTTTSLIIAGQFGRRHGNVLNKLDVLVERGRIKIESSSYKNSQNKEQRMFVLDERSFLIAMPFIGGKKSEEGQVRLVDEFLRLQKELSRIREHRLSIDWKEARANGKCIRSNLSGVIQCLERLADQQGGLKSEKKENRHYYETITKMIYKELLGDSSLKKIRDEVDSLTLVFLSICEQSCAAEIERLVAIGVDYHDIYSEAKKRVITTVEGLSRSKLTGESSVVKLAWDKN